MVIMEHVVHFTFQNRGAACVHKQTEATSGSIGYSNSNGSKLDWSKSCQLQDQFGFAAPDECWWMVLQIEE